MDDICVTEPFAESYEGFTPFSEELATLIRASFDSKEQAEQLGDSSVPEPFTGSNDEVEDFISKYTTLPSSPISSGTSDPSIVGHTTPAHTQVAFYCGIIFLPLVSPSHSPHPSTLYPTPPKKPRRKKNSRPTKPENDTDELVVDNGLTVLQRFSCAYCLKGYKNRADCKRHLAEHGELGLTYECRGCGEAFKRPDVRLKHWRTVPVCLDKDKHLTKNREWSRRHGRRGDKWQV